MNRRPGGLRCENLALARLELLTDIHPATISRREAGAIGHDAEAEVV